MTQSEPTTFHVMAKPAGARCNLHCAYCFFLKKEALYPGSGFRMSDEVMETYIRQTIEAHQMPHVTIAWQGGEPTLMGLDFFRRAAEAVKRYGKPGMTIEHTLQTNGVLVDEEWCAFLRENKFLVGLSLDGPRELHDAYRRDKAGKSVFDKVVQAARLMKESHVEFNVLCTVNAANSLQPLEVYRFFRDELKAPYLQFIPIVERVSAAGFQEGDAVTERSVEPGQYGRFLIEIFDEWVKRDVGAVFVQFFDSVLAAWLYGTSSVCVLQPTCGRAMAIEHNGDLYSCDHFVEPRHLLGNILATPLVDLVNSEKQRRFGQSKSATLPSDCRQCRFLFACHGECPKNRVLRTPNGEPGLNWLCAGLKAFFEHTERPMKIMAELLRAGQDADGIMQIVAGGQRRKVKPDGPAAHAGPPVSNSGPNDPCPCGSGKKFKRCHGTA